MLCGELGKDSSWFAERIDDLYFGRKKGEVVIGLLGCIFLNLFQEQLGCFRQLLAIVISSIHLILARMIA